MIKLRKILLLVFSLIFIVSILFSIPYSAIAAQDKINTTSQPSQTYKNQDNTIVSVENTITYDDSLEERERVLADLRYDNSLRVVFSYDEISKDFTMSQEGLNNKSKPIIRGEEDNFLTTFLAITPENVPVPELLSEEIEPERDLSAVIKKREISPYQINVTGLKLPNDIQLRSLDIACNLDGGDYYSWWDWHEGAGWLGPIAYYSSQFSGKKRYTDSYITNCTPTYIGNWIWARHRIYYKNIFGNYKKQFENKVPPGQWNAVEKGSIKRYRRVLYDDGWNSSPSCSNCRYIREGRFHN